MLLLKIHSSPNRHYNLDYPAHFLLQNPQDMS